MKTSSQRPSPSRLAARDGTSEPSKAESPQSPALSTTSTADCDSDSSPVLPPLPAPTLPGRALELLRTPPNEPENGRYVTASWGSPYPDNHGVHLHERSSSSEASGSSEDSPIHQLDINTPFLRPPPGLAENSDYAFVSASVLAKRARRQTRGLTEHWIRQHTASDLEEARLWLSDGTEEAEPSSLSGSTSSDLGWLEPHDVQTPRANPNHADIRRVSRRHPRTRSSVETLTPETLARMTGSPVSHNKMANSEHDQPPAAAAAEEPAQSSAVPQEEAQAPATPQKSVVAPDQEVEMPKPPSKNSPSGKKAHQSPIQRSKKKVPWKGKNILVLLPIDDERGQPGKAPMPLTEAEIQKMWDSWDELGYNTRGFDLNHDNSEDECESSQSKAFWPNHAEMAREHRERKFIVTLPDLNGTLTSPSHKP